MSAIRFSCPRCSRLFDVPAENAGQKFDCSCGQRLQVPLPSPDRTILGKLEPSAQDQAPATFASEPNPVGAPVAAGAAVEPPPLPWAKPVPLTVRVFATGFVRKFTTSEPFATVLDEIREMLHSLNLSVDKAWRIEGELMRWTSFIRKVEVSGRITRDTETNEINVDLSWTCAISESGWVFLALIAVATCGAGLLIIVPVVVGLSFFEGRTEKEVAGIFESAANNLEHNLKGA